MIETISRSWKVIVWHHLPLLDRCSAGITVNPDGVFALMSKWDPQEPKKFIEMSASVNHVTSETISIS